MVAVLEVTADVDVIVISDPVGHGSARGPHNCDHYKQLRKSIDKFSKPLSEAGAGLAGPETQVILNRDEEPGNLSMTTASTSSGGTSSD